MATHPLVLPSQATRAFLDESFPSVESLDSAQDVLNAQLYEWQAVEYQRAQLRSSLFASTAAILGHDRASSEYSIGDDSGYSPRLAARKPSLQKTTEAVSSLLERAQEIKIHTALNAAEVQPMVDELSQLAAEVAECERMRVYLEALLDVETRVAEVEELVTAAVALTRRELAAGLDPKLAVGRHSPDELWKKSKALPALRAASLTVATSSSRLSSLSISHPSWSRLLLHFSHRLASASASLLPSLRSCLRCLLATAAWPPPLSQTLFLSPPAPKPSSGHAPLSASSGKSPEGEGASPALLSPSAGPLAASFASLFVSCAALQRSEEQRQALVHRPSAPPSHSHSIPPGLLPPLWAVEELLAPLQAQAEGLWQAWASSAAPLAAAPSPARPPFSPPATHPYALSSPSAATSQPPSPAPASLGLALALRVARSHLSAVDALLQPAIDATGDSSSTSSSSSGSAFLPSPEPLSSAPLQASSGHPCASAPPLLRGCSAKEEWVRAVVRQLAGEFLRRHVAGPLAATLAGTEGRGGRGGRVGAARSPGAPTGPFASAVSRGVMADVDRLCDEFVREWGAEPGSVEYAGTGSASAAAAEAALDAQAALLEAVDEALAFDAAVMRLLVPGAAAKLAAAAQGGDAQAQNHRGSNSSRSGETTLLGDQEQEPGLARLWEAFRVESAVGVFAERREWLLQWLRCELQDARERLAALLLGEDAAWRVQRQQGAQAAGLAELADSGGIFGGITAMTPLGLGAQEIAVLSTPVAQQLVELLQSLCSRGSRLPTPVSRLAFLVGICRPLLLVFFNSAEQRLTEQEAAGTLVRDEGDVSRAGGVVSSVWQVAVAVEVWQEEEAVLGVWVEGSEAVARGEEEGEGVARDKGVDGESVREKGDPDSAGNSGALEEEEQGGWGEEVEREDADGWEIVDGDGESGASPPDSDGGRGQASGSVPPAVLQSPPAQPPELTATSAGPQPFSSRSTTDWLSGDGPFAVELALLRQLAVSWTDRLARALASLVCTMASGYRDQRSAFLLEDSKGSGSSAGASSAHPSGSSAVHALDGTTSSSGDGQLLRASSSGSSEPWGAALSPALVPAASALAGRLREAQEALPEELLVALVGAVAQRLDLFLCDEVVLGKEKGRMAVARSVGALVRRRFVAFSDLGGRQYSHDVQVVLRILSSASADTDSLLRRSVDAANLLRMPPLKARQLLTDLQEQEEPLLAAGVRVLSREDAEIVLKLRSLE